MTPPAKPSAKRPKEAAEADAIADLVNTLSIKRIEPERFHVIRDQVAKRLRRLADTLRDEPAAATTTWRAP